MILRPAVRLHHVQGIGRGHEDLGQQGIGIKGDRGDQLFDPLLGQGITRPLGAHCGANKPKQRDHQQGREPA